MVSIFISHAWSEKELYENFVATLDNVFGNTQSWINLSVPQSKAIDLCGNDKVENEYDRLEEELIYVQAALRKPGLSDAMYKVVWDVNGNKRVEETRSSLQNKHQKILNQIAHLNAYQTIEHRRSYEFRDRKNASESIRLHPKLSLAILQRIKLADIMFILVTPFCRFRRWMNYEISISRSTSATVVAVSLCGETTRDFYLDCHEIITLDDEKIRSIVAKTKAGSR